MPPYECPFCEWWQALGGTVDPAEILCTWDDHLDEHVGEMTREMGLR